MDINTKDKLDVFEGISLQIDEREYDDLDGLKDLLATMSQLTYKSVYVMDYYKKNFFYVSNGTLFLAGYTREEIMQGGFDYYIAHLTAVEMSQLRELRRGCEKFFSTIGKANKAQFTVSCDFHITHANGFRLLTNHKLTPLRLTKEGDIHLLMGVASLSTGDRTGNLYITGPDPNVRWIYYPYVNEWERVQHTTLSFTEKYIIGLAHQGLNTQDMARIMNKSEPSIKKYRKQLFRKLNVESMSDALSCVETHQLF